MSLSSSRSAGNASILLVITTLIWGGNAVAGKFAIGHVSPLLLTSARWSIAALILLAVAHRQLRADWPVLKNRLPYIFILGSAGFAVFNGLLYSALHETTAINVTIIQAGMPLFIFVLNFLIYRMATNWGQVVGYSLTLIGVLLTAASGDLRTLSNLQINHGDLIMIAAALLYAAYSVALRSKPAVHWLSFLTCLIVAAALTAIPMAFYEWSTADFIWPVTVTGWAVIFYTALLPSIVAQGFYIRGNELIGANRASLYINLVPIFGAFLAVLLLGEAFHFYHAIALALVIGGILMAQYLSRDA